MIDDVYTPNGTCFCIHAIRCIVCEKTSRLERIAAQNDVTADELRAWLEDEVAARLKVNIPT